MPSGPPPLRRPFWRYWVAEDGRRQSVGCLLQASLNAMKQNLLYTTILPPLEGLWRWPPQVMQRRVSRSTAAAFACLAATVEALTAMPALVPVPRTPLRHAQRSRTLFADVAAGWTTRADPNGDTYYFNEQTGQSQWELPQQAPGAPMLWRVVPAIGVYQHGQSALPRQCLSSPPATLQGAPGGSRQLGTPRATPSHWDPSHRLGGSRELPPESPISPRLTI